MERYSWGFNGETEEHPSETCRCFQKGQIDMKKLNTIQKRNNLNSVFQTGKPSALRYLFEIDKKCWN